MKKFRFLILAFLGCALLSFVACSNGNDDDSSQDGTYNLVSVSVGGATYTSDSDMWVAYVNVYGTLIVNGDTITFAIMPSPRSFWEDQGYSFTFSGNTATVSVPNSGTFTYQK